MNTLMEVMIAILNSLWQAALLAGLVWLVLRFARSMNAATRFAIWWAVLGVVLILPGALPMISAAREWLQPATIQATRPRYAPGPKPIPVIEFSPLVTVEHRSATHWPVYVAAAWGLILLYRLSQLVRSYLCVRRIKRRASVSTESLPLTQRSASLLLSSEIASPIAVGFARPAVILPGSLPARLSREEMDHVLLHETAHLARWDDWTNLLARFLAAALALHPVETWILRRIEMERERACDEWVVTRTQAGRPYARSLARLYEIRFPDQHAALLASGIFGNGSRLAERIEALLNHGREFTARVSRVRVGASCAVLIAFTAAASFLPHWIAFAQAPATFEAVSIRPNTSGLRVSWPRDSPGRLIFTNTTTLQLIEFAYGVQKSSVIGPDSLASDRYDLTANVAAPLTRTQMLPLLQSVLADRFALRLHTEMRTLPVYALRVAKSGSKLRPASANVACDSPGAHDLAEITGEFDMVQLAADLAGATDRPVIDATGLTGIYDVCLGYEPNSAAPDAGTSAPDIFTALREQLGLYLSPEKAPVKVLVIDHIERATPN